MINKNIAVVYAFDQAKQISMFYKSVKSLVKSNSDNDNLTLYLLVSKDLMKQYGAEIKLNLKEIVNFNFEIIPMKFTTGIGKYDGMFYWLISPFLIKDDYVVQLDNDTIVNTSINQMIKDYEDSFESNIFIGLKNTFEYSDFLRTTVKYFTSPEYYNKYKINYLNTGVAIINVKNYKKNIKNKKVIIKSIKNYCKLAAKLKLATYDQEFLVSFFGHLTAPILDYNFNSRITVPNQLDHLLFEKKFDGILHYNFYYWTNKDLNQRKKFDFEALYFNDPTYSKKFDEIWDAYKKCFSIDEGQLDKDELLIAKNRVNHLIEFLDLYYI